MRRVSGEGVGGVQIFDVEGVGAKRFVDSHFEAGSTKGTGGLAYGRLMDGDEVVDECLIIRKSDHVRLMLHGGRAIEARMQRLVEGAGIFIESDAMESRRKSLVEAEANGALQKARSVQTVLFLATVMQGSLVREVEGIRRFLAANPSLHVAPAASRLESLIQRAPFGCALLESPRIGVFGRPNVGKSTLFNALLGVERTLVHDTPGTTRDAVEAPVEWSGFPFRLIDTAGMREAETVVEAEGVQRAGALRDEVDLSIVVLDSSDEALVDEDPCSIIVMNKVDRLTDTERHALQQEHPGWIFTSALEATGLSDLRGRVVFRSVFAGPTVREMPSPFTRRQLSLLQRARQCLPSDRQAAVAVLAEFDSQP